MTEGSRARIRALDGEDLKLWIRNPGLAIEGSSSVELVSTNSYQLMSGVASTPGSQPLRGRCYSVAVP